MYTEQEVESILYQSWDEIGDIAYEIAERREEGKDCSALIDKGYDIRVLIQGYQYGDTHGLEEYKGEAILKALICLADINDYPAANLLYREITLNVSDGVPGPQGEIGPEGPQGVKGDQGDQGIQGDTGPQGIQGDQGEKGDTGDQGIQGIQGDQGDKGDTGDQGIQGEKGDQGPSGVDGDSYKATSVTSTTIPTSHPTQVTMTLSPLGLAYTPGQEIVTSYDIDNYFTGTVESYDLNTGQLVQQSSAHTGSGTYADWDINIGGTPGVQGKQLIHQEADIFLDDTKVTDVESGSWTPQDPWNASVRSDQRSSLSSPSGITGNMVDHSITYDGTDWNDNGVWRGPQGATGEKGDDGSQGVKGDTGDQGIQGVKGDTGDQGIKGDQGIQGVKGDTGDQGIQGEKGDTGDQGPTGAQGAKGDKGDKGDQGEVGPQEIKLISVNTGTQSSITVDLDDEHAFYEVMTTGSGDTVINIPPKPSSNPSDTMQISIGKGAQGSTLRLRTTSSSNLLWYQGVFYGNGGQPDLIMEDDNKRWGLTFAWSGNTWYCVGADDLLQNEGNQIWVDDDEFITSGSTSTWTRVAIMDIEDGTYKPLLFVISSSFYGDSGGEWNIRLRGHTYSGTWITFKSWSYKPDITASYTYAVPTTMQHATNSSFEEWQVEIIKANNHSGSHRETTLSIFTLNKLTTS